MDSKYNIFENKSQKRKFHLKNVEHPTTLHTKKLKIDKEQNNNVSVKTSTVNITPKLSLLDQRRSLPVYCVRARLMEEIRKNETVIVIGETGSGKTTQIPQLIHESQIVGTGVIGITQPRRVAAITVAMRVSQEMGTKLGDVVGYTVRFEDMTSQRTKVKYMTDGMLLREAMLDSLLLSYSIIVLDEAHERTVNTDVLFGIIKLAQIERKRKKHPALKIIIMSATMDVDKFSNYLNNCPVIYLEGRTFPVTIYHTKSQPNDYQQAALCTIFQIHREFPIKIKRGTDILDLIYHLILSKKLYGRREFTFNSTGEDVLVFLTGQEEIETLAYNIRKIAKEISKGLIKVCPMYANLPQTQQLDVFRPVQPNMRKVILATNIAETSVTIPNIKFVIDTGVVKARTCCGCTEILKVEPCSQAACWQRSGRAGRDSPGRCYRLYTVNNMSSRPQHTLPPILRSPLVTTFLQLLVLNVDPATFDLIDKPPLDSIQQAKHLLIQLGAVINTEVPSLTNIGKKMATFPIDPRLSKVILSAGDYGCLEEILTIVALLSTDGIYHSSINKREEALKAKSKFISPLGDHITLLNVYKEFINVPSQKKWCQENFLKYNNLRQAVDIRKQLLELCQKHKLQIQSCDQVIEKVMKSLVHGLYVNTAWMRNGLNSSSGGRYMTASSIPASIHPSSVLHGVSPQPSCVLYTELITTQRSYITMLSVMEPKWLDEIVPDFARKCKILS